MFQGVAGKRMTKQKRAKKTKKSARKKKRKWPILLICLLFLGLAAVVVYGLMSRSSTETTTAIKATILPKKEKADFDRLIGRWVRPDGGYVIEIRSIHPDGKVDAAYFNPRPIHVSRSNVSDEGGIIKLFIELQGQGYPGSTYTLKYNSESDVLVGVYFQAVIKQPFEVVFQRR
jgi:hypothetical protein